MIPEINIQLAKLKAHWLTEEFTNQIELAHNQLIEHTGSGNEFHGWIDLPERMLNDESIWTSINRIEQQWKALDIKKIVIIGIGGSYLGAKAIYEALNPQFSETDAPELIFAGHHMSAAYLDNLVCHLNNINFGIVVISKSGTTLEPAMAFRILKSQLTTRFGNEGAALRIIAITDPLKGALRKMTNSSGWTSFAIDDSVGGRYSVFSPVGIIPLSLAGIDMKSMLKAALQMQSVCTEKSNVSENPALMYAAIRTLLFRENKTIEILSSFQAELQYLIEWWKQLFGESDGKNLSGIFPAGTVFSTDLHSMGQYIQEGLRNIFETFIVIKNKPGNMSFPSSENNEDGLEYLAGRNVKDINSMAEQATMLAHNEGNVPVISISIEALDVQSLGALMYFFEFACAAGGYLLGINPFDQPGVEAYKKNMFALLGKPGMEEETAKLIEKIKSIK
jgi:glucose-6-phosphate isomerase